MAHTPGWAVFLIIVLIFAALAGSAFFLYVRVYKKRQLNNSAFPSPAPAGIGAWFKNTFESLKNKRSKTGGYEGAGYAGVGGAGGGSVRGRAAHGGPLDPDEAWDSRVGNEAEVYGPGGYYEEQELGLHPQNTAYSGAGYTSTAAMSGGAGFAPAPGLSIGADERGRSRSPARQNPFEDDAAASLRSDSPRPMETGPGIQKGSGGNRADSPTGRRSMFRENM